MNRLLKNKKGFTLVELIVVLVILAILLALLVPALTGWIDKAREKQVLINGRTLYLAVQTLEDEEYGRTTNYSGHSNDGSCTVNVTELKELAGLDYNDSNNVSWTTDGNGNVTKFHYEESNYEVSLDTDTSPAEGLKVAKK